MKRRSRVLDFFKIDRFNVAANNIQPNRYVSFAVCHHNTPAIKKGTLEPSTPYYLRPRIASCACIIRLNSRSSFLDFSMFDCNLSSILLYRLASISCGCSSSELHNRQCQKISDVASLRSLCPGFFLGHTNSCCCPSILSGSGSS